MCKNWNSNGNDLTRSEAKKIIKAKKVMVNGVVINKDDYKIEENTDVVLLDNKQIIYQQYIYIMLNKPSGYLSASEDTKDKTVLDLISEYKYLDLFPVGRLDKDSVGLLLITNNGKLAHNMLSPRKHVEKTYYLRISGRLDSDDINSFKEGIVLEDDYKCKEAKLEIIKSDIVSECLVTISEGKFHQLKRMFKMVGKEVLYLKRISFGPLKLDDNLKEGEYRMLTEKELSLIKEYLPK